MFHWSFKKTKDAVQGVKNAVQDATNTVHDVKNVISRAPDASRPRRSRLRPPRSP